MSAKEITRRIYVDAIPLGEAVALIEDALAEEREACAKVAETVHLRVRHWDEYERLSEDIAAAIRARRGTSA